MEEDCTEEEGTRLYHGLVVRVRCGRGLHDLAQQERVPEARRAITKFSQKPLLINGGCKPFDTNTRY